jgi:uncharacterized peroxidase-related enzyme
MRLPPPSIPWFLQLFRRAQVRRHGRALEPTELWSYRPRAMLGFLHLFRALRSADSPLSAELRARVSVCVSELNGCAFCVDLNSSLLTQARGRQVESGPVSEWRADPTLDARARLALEYAEAMTRTPPDVGDELFARLQAAFAPDAIVELTAVIAFQNLSARFNAALGANPHGFCAVPGRPAMPAPAPRSR